MEQGKYCHTGKLIFYLGAVHKIQKDSRSFLPDPHPSPLKRNLSNIETREPYKLVTSHPIHVSRSTAKQLYIRGEFQMKQNLSLFLF